MGVVEFFCPNFGRLKVCGDRLHDGHDFVFEANTSSELFDYLVFFDSRGISREYDNSLADKLTSKITSMGKTYLLICRPLELTIWATLIGFLKINRLNPAKIITNMGFVDFTPKKQTTLQDAVRQVELSVGHNVATSFLVEDYLPPGAGQAMSLFLMQYGKEYRLAIEKIATQQPLVIINTPLTDTGIAIEKKRPPSFFPALEKSNEFNRSINGAQIIDLPDFDEAHTYDAVHYTSRGNDVIFERLTGFL